MAIEKAGAFTCLVLRNDVGKVHYSGIISLKSKQKEDDTAKPHQFRMMARILNPQTKAYQTIIIKFAVDIDKQMFKEVFAAQTNTPQAQDFK